MTGNAPTGTATVVMGDIAGSTRLWQEHPAAMAAVSRLLPRMLDELARTHEGHLPREQGEGDNVVATFAVAANALAFAVSLDRALSSEDWPAALTIAMRIGIHTGDVVWDQDVGYLGPTFNRCARLRDLGRARMILLSQTTRDVVGGHLPDGATLADLGVHQLRDMSRSERVHQLRHEGSPERFRPLKSVTVLPNNLPVPVTSLFGREADIEHVEVQFADHRLVTLTGAGGSGKTRLAQHVAADLLRLAPDGAWWVDLMPVAEDDRVPVAMADGVGIPDVTPSQRAAEVVAAGIGDRRMLVVLDNCEHLIDAVADTVELLLQRCPNVRVLATSREALDVAGERVVRVRPLGLPEEPEPALADLQAHPATSLFLDRSTTLDHGALDATQRRLVARICRRLDGMPLAIELAAARTRVLSVADIEVGLDNRFGLLRAGRRGRRAGARQRTLEASVAWSFDLLADDEEAMLCRLAVFPAAFDLDGAHAVGAPGGRAAALDLLSALVDKSLVAIRPADDGRRYRLLESIRHYALERLRERGDGEAARLAHLDHTVARVAALAEADGRAYGVAGPVSDIPPSLADDMRTADATAMASGRHDRLVDLYRPMLWTLMFQGTYHDALPSLLEVVRDDARLGVSHRAHAYVQVLTFLSSAGRHDEVMALSERAVDAGREMAGRHPEPGPDDVVALAGILATLSHSAAYGGHDGAAAYARESVELGRVAVARSGESHIRTGWTYCVPALAYDGHTEEASAVAEDALHAADEHGYAHVGALAAQYRLVTAFRLARPLPELERLLADAVDRVPASTPRMLASVASIQGTWVAVLGGKVEEVGEWVERGLACAGPPGSGTHMMMSVGRVIDAYARGDVDELLARAAEADAALAPTDGRWWRGFLAVWVAMGKVHRGDADTLDAVDAGRSLLPSDRWPMVASYLDVVEAQHQVTVGQPTRTLELAADVALRERRTAVRCAYLTLPAVAAAHLALDRADLAAQALGAHARTLEELGYVDLHRDLTEAVTVDTRTALGSVPFRASHRAGASMSHSHLLDWLAGDAPRRVERPVAGWDALTPAEVEVSRRVADGLTNREVGEALFVSENTVKTHLKSVYGKLDISSRAELATRVAASDA